MAEHHKWLVWALTPLALVACGGDDDDDDAAQAAVPQAEVRIVHASADAPAVNAGLNGGNQVPGLEFASATDFLTVDAGAYDVTVDGILADGSTVNVIDAPGVSLNADAETSIIAVGNVADDSIAALVVGAPDEDPDSGSVRAHVVHASAAAAPAGALDVYVTAPAETLAAASPLGAFEFQGAIGPVTIAAGDYRIRVTPAGDSATVLFDSGTVPLAGGSDLLIAAIDNTGPANGPRGAPIRLLVAPEGGSSFLILDEGAQAAARAAHLSADAGAVDVSVDGINNDAPVVTGLTFDNPPFSDNFTDFLALPPGTQTLNLEQGGTVAVSASADLEAGQRYTAYALGLVSPGMAFQGISIEALTENIRAVATEARVRVVHAASQVPTPDGQVDIYLLADQSATVSDLSADNRILDDVPFKAVTDYLSVVPGDASTYKLFITAFNDPTVAPIVADLPALEGGGVYTVVALDEPDATGVAPAPGILVDNTP